MNSTVQLRQSTKRFPVLATKLLAPPARPDTIDRPALNRRLSAGLAGRLIVIAAPPGFGKTTAVVNWHRTVAEEGWQLGWVALDPGDNDLSRFLTYLVHGLRVLGDDFGDDALSLLQSAQHLSWHVPITVLLNELESNTQPVVLVLDDYHEIDEPEIHDALTYLIEHLPATVRIIITSRTDPPLSLPLLRARRELTQIGIDQLRFTNDEASAFINGIMRLDLSAQQIEELERRTEGWIAGLLLAALSVGETTDAENLLSTFSGAHHFVFDYLAEEVLNRQTEELQSFLLKTSVLDQLSAQLCEGVTGKRNCADILTQLDDANLFVVRLDQSRNWYRYHHLFGEFLANRFQREDPEGWRTAHLRAADAYERQRLYHQAIGHAMVVEDYDRAAELIVETGMRTVKAGRSATLKRWFAALPEEVIRSWRELMTIRTWSLLMERDFAGVTRELERHDELAAQSDVPHDEWSVSAVRVSLALLTGNLARTIELGEEALQSLPPNDVFGRSMVQVHLGTAHRMRGDVIPAVELLTTGMELSEEAGNTPAWLIAASQRAIAWMTIGDLRLAHDAFREIIGTEAKLGVTRLGFGIASHLGLAEILREWDNVDEAEEVLSGALDVLTDLNDREQFGTKLYALLILLRLRMAQGRLTESLEIADDALRQASTSEVPGWELERAAAFRARTLLGLGRLDDAEIWARSTDPPVLPFESQREIAYQMLARVDIAAGRHSSALEIIARAREIAAEGSLRRRLIELDALTAIALAAQKQHDRAAAFLSRSLGLAEPDGYRRVYIDDIEELLPVMRELRNQRPADATWTTAYLDSLMVAAGGEVVDATATSDSGVEQLVDPLTERELEVLGLLAEGLTNRQVAEQLFLSVGTIKRHTHNIYGKLGVRSRTQAIVRGQSLGLLN
jgi:LuxR family maltose regulon positive regulatory protein